MHETTDVKTRTDADRAYTGAAPPPKVKPSGDSLPASSVKIGQRWKSKDREALICEDGDEVAVCDMATGKRIFKGAAAKAEGKLIGLGFKNG